jgi:hypothetical protein
MRPFFAAALLGVAATLLAHAPRPLHSTPASFGHSMGHGSLTTVVQSELATLGPQRRTPA